MSYECEQTVANTCESITNKANGLRFFLHFLENALRMRAHGCQHLRVLANDIETLRLSCKYLANS